MELKKEDKMLKTLLKCNQETIKDLSQELLAAENVIYDLVSKQVVYNIIQENFKSNNMSPDEFNYLSSVYLDEDIDVKDLVLIYTIYLKK